MSNPAFVLENGNLTYDPVNPYLCTDEDHVSYGTKGPVPPPPRPRRRFGAAAVGGRGCFGGLPCKIPVRGDGEECDKEPSFARTAVDLLRPKKGRESRQKKKRPTPERETIYDLRSRLARIREMVARLEAERGLMAMATEEMRARFQAELRELLIRMAELERELLDSCRERAELEREVLESLQARAALSGALRDERAARKRGALLVGAGLGTAALTLILVPAGYSWAGYAAAGGLALWGLAELVVPA